jgi:hypothetical protein
LWFQPAGVDRQRHREWQHRCKPGAHEFIDFTTIHGNVISNGGGDITAVDPGGLVFPIKDNVIDGNVIVNGWEGAWFGIIRNTIGGNVSVIDTAGTRVDPATGILDSTEIVTNIIGGNLVCLRNTPPAQIGDSEGEVKRCGRPEDWRMRGAVTRYGEEPRMSGWQGSM